MCDAVWPHRRHPTGSSVPGTLQARILEWVAISFSNAWKWKVKVKSLSRVQLLATPWTAAYQAPLSMGFSRQDYWSGLPLPFLNVWVTVLQKSIVCFLKYIPEAKQYGNSKGIKMKFSSVQFSTVAQSCPTIWDPMNCSTTGLPVHHQILEFTQPHVHRVIDAIQPSHPLSFHFPPAPIASQHQSLFQWVNSSHEVAKVLEFQL